MFTEKMRAMMKRQMQLVAKKPEEMTEAERAELNALNTAIAMIVDDEQPVAKAGTKLTTMTKDEFTAYVAEQMTAMEKAPSADRLAMLKRNIDAVRDQAAEGKELFAVEIAVQKTNEDALASALSRIGELEAQLASVAAKSEPQTTPPAVDEPPAGEAIGKGVASDMASEAMDAILTRFTTLKGKLSDGSVTMEDVEKAFEGQWELRRFIDMAAALMTKAAELQQLIGPVVAALEAIDKQDDSASAAAPDGDANGEGEGEGEPVQKSDESFSWGGDLAKEFTPAPEDEYRAMKSARRNS